jgi:NAD(P)-dependent dehydrogenase (short-subunit alcohol dehydrogenase family)
MDTISLKTKTALVTGTDHGVGFSLAKKLLSRGYFVIAVRVDETEKQIDALQSSYPDQMAIVCADIGSDESVFKASNDIKNLTDHIDLLINCAGILGDMSKNLGDDLDFDEISRVINVNAIGTLRITNALSSLVLNSTEKTIVNISSEAGSIADCWRTGWFGYCMSKAANNMQSALVHNNMRELGGKVFAIHPGHVATYMRGHLDTTAKITPDVSAEGILHVVLDMPHPINSHPLYLDYTGKELLW